MNKNLGYTADGIKIDVDYEHEVFPIEDYLSKHPVFVEVNWNKEVAPAEFMRLKWENREGESQELVLNREEVQTILFLLAPSAEEEKYLRGRTQELRRDRHEFRVKAGRDIKKGDEIIINKNITY